MDVNEAIETGLQIKSNLYRLSMADFKYKPEYYPLMDLAKNTGIHHTTISDWCKKGKIKYVKDKRTMIQLHSFVIYILFHYRYKTMNSRHGKWWNKSEINEIDQADRSPLAKKIKKCRIK